MDTVKKMRIEYCQDTLNKIQEGIKITPDAYKIGEAAILGMLYEVSTSPSPGLVSPYSRGSHKDMDYFTFLRSTASISHAMYLCAQIGMDYEEDILKRVRTVGIAAEKNMLSMTSGVNTQRGLLFLAGIVSAAAGRCIGKSMEVNRFNISNECKYICSNIVERELKSLNLNEKLTNGEKLYLKYGVAGIREEVEKGLPSILETSLSLLEEGLSEGLELREALSHSLIGLMAVVEDTTVINRKGLEGLELMRREAKNAISLGGMKTSEGREQIRLMEELFENHNISPGGAADLLAITVMIFEIEKNWRGRNTNEKTS